MPIETANYITELDPTNPSAPDLLADTDNHLRMIKQVLKNTFPNVATPVTATGHQLNAFVPPGIISMWYGSTASIPVGWGLCNGTTYAKADGSGTIVSPNLSDKFIKGCLSVGTDVGTLGGSTAKAGTTNAAGSHNHTGTTDIQGLHVHGSLVGYTAITEAQMPSHAHTVTAIVDFGGSGSGLYFPSTNLGTNTFLTGYVGGNQAHTHTIGSDGAHGHNLSISTAANHSHTVTIDDGRPSFYTLAFVMKL